MLVFIFFCLLSKEIFAFEKININSASLSELDQLTGIGPTYAQKIIEGRPYLSLDDLLKVKGIGTTTLQKIKDQALACVDCMAQITNPSEQKVNIVSNLPQTIAPSPETIYPSGVVFNEILPSPEGADEENEFIEIYNKNNFDVDLSGWKIKDMEGVNTTFTIPNNIKILANNFLLFKRPQTKISLNNAKDVLNLILPNNKIIDSVSFIKAPLNQSYNKTDSNWFWSTNLTPNKQNIVSQVSLNNSKINLLKTDNSGKNTVESDKLLASIIDSKITNKKNTINNPWFLFIIVLTISIILSIVVLIFKLRFSKNRDYIN